MRPVGGARHWLTKEDPPTGQALSLPFCSHQPMNKRFFFFDQLGLWSFHCLYKSTQKRKTRYDVSSSKVSGFIEIKQEFPFHYS